MADDLLTHRGVVYPWQCDHMGHMNVMWYVGKFDEATWHLFAAIGLTPSYVRDSGCGMAAVEQHLRYQRELPAGATIEIRSRVLEARDKVIRFAHEMLDAQGHVAARTEVTGVHFDRRSRKSCPLPAEVVARARSMIG